MHVLITGAAGNLGPTVCRAFVEDGQSARVLLHRKRPRNLDSRVEIAWGDVTDAESVRRAMDGVDAIVHLAGLVQPQTEAEPELAERVNVGGTRVVLDEIKRLGSSIAFVFTSSTAVFGACPEATECLHPDRNPCNPTSVYGQTKARAEEMIRESEIEYVILRLTSIPYQRLGISDFRTHMFTIPLENRIEFCHPQDMAHAVLNSVKRFDAAKGNTLMIGGGPSQQMLFEDMLRTILGKFGLPVPPRHKFASEPFPLHWYDTSASQELLEYQRRTIDDYCNDLASQFPTPALAVLQRFIGPALGRLIVRLI
jgi:nucleoside-diphosphate-sugar epimerase